MIACVVAATVVATGQRAGVTRPAPRAVTPRGQLLPGEQAIVDLFEKARAGSVGVAIPVDRVNRVVPQLIASGRYVRPALGIEANEGLNELISKRLVPVRLQASSQ